MELDEAVWVTSIAPWVPWLLAGLRVWAILRAQILWRTAVGPWWPVVAVAIAAVLVPAIEVTATFPAIPSAWLIAAVAEFSLGTLLGIVIALPGHALVGAGMTAAVINRASMGSLVFLFASVAGGLALELALHRPLLLGLASTFEWFELGRPSLWLFELTTGGASLGLPDLVTALHGFVMLLLTMVTPLLMTAAVAEIGLGIIGGGPAPASATSEGLRVWARTAGALIALGASWAAYGEIWARAATTPPAP